MTSTADGRFMVYGANGYTGRLVAEEARRRGLKPVLAGRSPKAVEELAERLGLEAEIFGLDDPREIGKHLDGVAVMLHCAGPFSATSRPMLAACVTAGTHYADITGEIEVFEYIHGRGEDLERSGVVAIPGAGFDVVPSDCLAAMLKRDLPSATHLTLAFRSNGKPSPGTLKTMVEGLPGGGRVRRDGVIVAVPTAYRVAEIAFRADDTSQAIPIPWGDVSTAYYSTGIPNIEVLMGVTPGMLRGIRASAQLRGFLGTAFAQRTIKRLIQATVPGPSAAEREGERTDLWGEVRDGDGGRAVRRMSVPSSYGFTADAALAVVQRLLAGGIEPGARTPSMAFGADFVMELDGVTVERVEVE